MTRSATDLPARIEIGDSASVVLFWVACWFFVVATVAAQKPGSAATVAEEVR